MDKPMKRLITLILVLSLALAFKLDGSVLGDAEYRFTYNP